MVAFTDLLFSFAFLTFASVALNGHHVGAGVIICGKRSFYEGRRRWT